MSVIATAKKTIGSRSPYIGDTFQELTELLLGQDGYISGGAASDDTVNITVEPFVIVQRGIFAQTEINTTGLAVPVGSEPWFVLAAIPDDSPESGVVLTATRSFAAASTGLVLAFKTGNVWQNPGGVSIRALGERAAEPGKEQAFSTFVEVDGSQNITDYILNKGSLVDPDGFRRFVPSIAGESAKALSVPVVRVPDSSTGNRRDHLVLRQRESGSAELKYLIGGLGNGGGTGELALESGGLVKRPHYFARRAGSVAEQWWAWGNGTALRIQGGPSGEAFAAVTLLSGASDIEETWVPGQRSSDSAVVIVYLDGTLVRVVSINPATGAQIDAPVTIDTEPNAIVRIRAVLDLNEDLHVVYEHDEGGGPPSQQIYYTKVSVATATFGLHSVTPRRVTLTGAVSGSNDTWPSLAVDRFGTAAVSCIRGTTTDEFGNLVVSSVSATGAVTSQVVFLPGSDVAITDTVDEDGLRGFVSTAFDDFRRTATVFTDFDELYVFTLGTPTSSGEVDHILAHAPNFEKDHGFALMSVSEDGLTAGTAYEGLAAASGEQGEIFVSHKQRFAGVFTNQQSLTLDSRFFKNGLHEPKTVLATDSVYTTFVDGTIFGDIAVARGPIGEMVPIYRKATTASTAARPSLSNFKLPGRHPKDVYITNISLGSVPGGVVNKETEHVHVFNVREKRMNFPVLVGKDGDFQGFDSLSEALDPVAGPLAGGGGDVVLRQGYHAMSTSAAVLPSGTRIIGEGSIVEVQGGGSVLSFGFSGAAAPLSIVGSVIDVPFNFARDAKPGDLVFMAGGGGTGFHTILKNLGRTSATSHKVLVADNASGSPAGTTVDTVYSGCHIENVTFKVNLAGISDIGLGFAGCNQPTARNIKFVGSQSHLSSRALDVNNCIAATIENIDFNELDGVLDTHAIDIRGAFTRGTTVRGAKLVGGRHIQIAAASVRTHLIDCHSDGTSTIEATYVVLGPRSVDDPVYMVACEGRVKADDVDAPLIVTNTGRRLRVPGIHPTTGVADETSPMEFEDAYTRDSTIPSGAIALTSSTAKEFNGPTKDVIVASVNERVRKVGDTMTGALVHDNSAGPASAEIQRIVSNDAQTEPIYQGTAKGGVDLGHVVDAFGGINRMGLHFYDEFLGTGTISDKWSSFGTSTTNVYISPAAASIGASAGNSSSLRPRGLYLKRDNFPRIHASVKHTWNSNGDVSVQVGPVNFHFLIDPSDKQGHGILNGNWHMIIEGDASSPHDLGVAGPADGVTHILYLMVVDTDKVRWQINGIPEDWSSPLGEGLLTSASPIPPAVDPDGNPRLTIDCVGTGAESMEVNFFEAFESRRS